VHAVSDAVREFTIQADRVNPRKVVTIPNGVDLKAIGVRRDVMSLRAAYGLKNASHVITDVTTVKYVKGVDVLVRTAAVVCREYPQAMFVVAGLLFEDDYLRALRDLIRSSGLERNFRLLGPCDNVFPLLQMSDVFCHLSRTDGLSNALLEAMACELPCVVSNAGGNPEVVEQGCGGFIVPSEEPETAADRILAFLRNPALGRRMGASARRTVEERFSARGMVRRLVALYDDLLALRGQS
jgi:glycosyltransferase involved in cell wall biosynthesis